MSIFFKYAGLSFESNIYFPFFYQMTTPPVKFFYVQEENYTSPLLTNQAVFVSHGRYYINFSENGYYEVTKEGITCRFKDKQLLYATICNLPFAILSILNGILPLHSSAVSDEKSTYIFLGEKGAGKTTLAYLLSAYGPFEVMGDDMIGISSPRPNQISAMRGSKSMKLCGSFCDLEGLSREDEIYPQWDKYFIDAPRTATNDVCCIKRLYVIQRGAIVRREKIFPALTENMLYRHVVSISWLEPLMHRQIRELIRPLRGISLYSLQVPESVVGLKNRLSAITSCIK